ncbi:molybdopterin-dependent oxidoreductase [Haloparvum sp. PAK95]|uniref:molybdopterin-dependent oxidoreductase n=1 Tax=Haloparvum sp. PAK95 TaxID=3418962 RepID=UPI003D2F10B9
MLTLPGARGAVTRRRLRLAAVFVASGVAAVAGSFLVAGRGPTFVVTALAATLLYLSPDGLLAWGIVTLGKYGRPLLVAGAVATSVLVFTGIAAGATVAADRLHRKRPDSLFAVGFLQAAVTFALTINPLSSVAAGFAGGLTVALAGAAVTDRESIPSRRGVLKSVGTAAAAIGAGYFLAPRPDAVDPDSASISDANVEAMLQAADERSIDVPGLEPLVSEDFYQVDINTSTPVVDREEWSLTIEGDASPLTIDYEELRAREAQHRFVTLRCVSDELNGYTMDTALWTGVPIDDLLEEADAPESCCVFLEAEDGYYQAFPREALANGFLAWGMNGKVLPRGHGHPARALIPGHWGEINVKWLSRIEIREEPATGYWEERGWAGTGPVETIAKLHSIETSDDGTVVVGGHAYAGVRGIDRVELSRDGGETWAEATLSDRLPGSVPAVDGDGDGNSDGNSDGDASPIESVAEDAWRMWCFEYQADSPHEVTVRAIEPDGTVQPKEETDSFPSGATGWVTRSVDV